MKEVTSIGLAEQAGVENNQMSFVILAADQTTQALPEFSERFRDGKIGKGVSASAADVFEACFAQRVSGVFKG